jgi:hypothetical protein
METKKDNIMICNICKFGIDTSKQYAEFIHWANKDKQQSKAFYHVDCYRERMLGSAKGQYLMARANKLLNKAEEIIR